MMNEGSWAVLEDYLSPLTEGSSSHPLPILTLSGHGRGMKLKQEGVIYIMNLQKGNCWLICVLALIFSENHLQEEKVVKIQIVID